MTDDFTKWPYMLLNLCAQCGHPRGIFANMPYMVGLILHKVLEYNFNAVSPITISEI